MAGNKQGRKRRFGSIRALPSGRFQARYLAPDGTPRNAPDTFDTKTAAEEWLADVETDMRRGDWADPEHGKLPFREYAAKWLRERELRSRTRQEYERVFRLHVLPYVGDRNVNEFQPSHIRTWRSERLEDGVGSSTVAKAYRIMHAIFTTAVEDDEMLKRNPCRIKKGGQDLAEERPTASLEEVFSIADSIQRRYRLLVLLACFAQLRFSELVNLRRGDIRTGSMEIRVHKVIAELDGGEQREEDPKSAAGRRWISLPKSLQADVEWHFANVAQPGRDGRLFLGPLGGIPRRRNFNRVWKKALKEAGIKTKLRLHDLRHTGSTLIGPTASLKELMARIGHSSTRAAMNYQHARRDRDHAIAAALDLLILEHKGQHAG